LTLNLNYSDIELGIRGGNVRDDCGDIDIQSNTLLQKLLSLLRLSDWKQSTSDANKWEHNWHHTTEEIHEDEEKK
jgi:hypothetical protein